AFRVTSCHGSGYLGLVPEAIREHHAKANISAILISKLAILISKLALPLPFGSKLPTMNKDEIAWRIKELRVDRHLHQKEVAAALGISPSSYCDRENGHTAFTAEELDKLAEFHGKTLDELLHADRAVMHMNDHASNGFNAYHMEHPHGASEELMK